MSRSLISSGSAYEKVAGYSRAVVDGRWVFVAGTTGFDYARMTIADDVTEQARQAFRNIRDTLKKADAALADIVRATYYLTRAEDWETLAPIFGEFLGDVRPAATAIVCTLIDPRMKLEIEVTARRRRK